MTASAPTPAADADHAEFQRRIERLEAAAHVGSWEWDVAADRITWSAELHRIFGVDPADFEASYSAYLALIHPDDREDVDGRVQRAYGDGQPFALAHRIRRPDGQVRWLQSEGTVEMRADGPLRMFGFAKDVTDERIAAGRFETLLEAAPDAMILVDRAGTILLVNVQTEVTFGYEREELIGKPMEILVPEALRGAHARHRAGFQAQPRTRPMGAGLDLRARRKDGTELAVEISLSPIESPDGHMVLAAIRDISDRVLARDREAQAREHSVELDRLRAMNEFKTHLLNTAAHELNTPLTPLRLQLHLLRSGGLGALTDRQGHALLVLDRNVKRLSALVTDMLDVARIESGHLKIKPEPVAVKRLAAESIESFAETAHRVGVDIRIEVPDDLVVMADPARLTQVFYNLITNALKFTGDGGTVTVAAAREDDEAAIWVHDTGIGMTKEQMARLFHAFSQVHEDVQHGTGLGLFICKGIIQEHDGTISVRSDGPGRGSTFRFTLPVSKEPLASPRPAPVGPARVSPAPVTPPRVEPAPDRMTRTQDDPVARRLRELI
jgi:PAS domain S-box-containing protein